MPPERADEGEARTGASRLRADPRPRCPHLRVCRGPRPSPVRGYCVLADTPGWFMIPSLEVYREVCTTPRWRDCGWFQVPSPDGADEIGSAQVEERPSA
jgi:hypothetical protein